MMPTDPNPPDRTHTVAGDPPAPWTAPGQTPFVKKGQFVPGDSFADKRGTPKHTDPVAPHSGGND